MDRKTRKANLKKLQLPAIIGQQQQQQQTRTPTTKQPINLDEICDNDREHSATSSRKPDRIKRIKLDTFLYRDAQSNPSNNQNSPANMDSTLEIPEKKSKTAPKIAKGKSKLQSQSNSRLKATKSKSKSTKSNNKFGKQMTIKSALLRNEQMFAELAAQHSAAEQFDGDEIQLALAISKSEHDLQCIQDEPVQDQSDTPAKSKAEIYRKKLERYGFRTGNKEDYKAYALNCMPGIWNRRPKGKWCNKFTALTLRDADKQLKKVHENVEKILSNCNKTHESSVSAAGQQHQQGISYCLTSHLLSQCKESARDQHSILAIDHYDDPSELEKYFVADLFAVSEVSAGYLLRDWRKIQGRDISPSSIKDRNSLKMDLILEDAYRDLEQHVAHSRKHLDNLEGLNVSLYHSKASESSSEIFKIVEGKNPEEKTVSDLVSTAGTQSQCSSNTLDVSSYSCSEGKIEKGESCFSSSTDAQRAVSPDLFADSDIENPANELDTTKAEVNKDAVYSDSSKDSCKDEQEAEDALEAAITTYEIFSSDEVNDVCTLEVDNTNNLKPELGMERECTVVDLTQCDVASPDDCQQSEQCENSREELQKTGDLTFHINAIVNAAEEEAEAEANLPVLTAQQSDAFPKSSKSLNDKTFSTASDGHARDSGSYSLTDANDSEIFERLCQKYLGYTNSTQVYQGSKVHLNTFLSMPITSHHKVPDSAITLEAANGSESNDSFLATNKKAKDELNEDLSLFLDIPLNKGRKSKSFSLPRVRSICDENVRHVQSKKSMQEEINEPSGPVQSKNLSNKSNFSIDLTQSDDDTHIRGSDAAEDLSSERKKVNETSDDASSDDDCCLLLSDDEINYSIWKSSRSITRKKSIGDDDVEGYSNDDEVKLPSFNSMSRLSFLSEGSISHQKDTHHPLTASTAFNIDTDFSELCNLITPEKCINSATLDTSRSSSPTSLTSTPSTAARTSTKCEDRLQSISNSEALTSQAKHLPEDFDQLLVGEIRNIEDLPTASSPCRNHNKESRTLEYSPEEQRIEIKDRIYIVRYTESPKPQFTEMTDIELWKKLSAYGIKPLKRKHAVKMLEYVYNQTHPIIESPIIEPAKSTSDFQFELDTESQTAISTAGDGLTGMQLQVNEVDAYQLNAEATGEDLLRYSDSLLPELPKEEFIMQSNVTRKTPRPLLPLHIAWYNLLCANRKLHEAVLMFQPIDLHAIYSHLKCLGYRYEPKDLKTFFDQRCIVFRYDMTSNQSKANPRLAQTKAGQH